MKRRALLLVSIVAFMFPISATAGWCTVQISQVITGGNGSNACWVAGILDSDSSVGFTNLSLCSSSDQDANARNFSLVMAAMISGKRVQMYSGDIDCQSIPNGYAGVTKLTMLRD